MSKTKKIKQKTTGFDIVYRVVTAIMAILIYPLFFFLDIIYIQVDHKAIADIWGSITQNATPDLGATYEDLSIPDMFEWADMLSAFKSEESTFTFNNPNLYPLYAAIGFVALALVIGLVILGFAIFSNKVGAIIGLSASGLVCTIVSYFCFTSGFANPIIDGEVTISQLLGPESNNLLDLIFGFVGNISFLNLEGGFFWVLFLMLGILVWSVSVLVVNKGEEKEKAMKAAARKNN